MAARQRRRRQQSRQSRLGTCREEAGHNAAWVRRVARTGPRRLREESGVTWQISKRRIPPAGRIGAIECIPERGFSPKGGNIFPWKNGPGSPTEDARLLNQHGYTD